MCVPWLCVCVCVDGFFFSQPTMDPPHDLPTPADAESSAFASLQLTTMSVCIYIYTHLHTQTSVGINEGGGGGRRHFIQSQLWSFSKRAGVEISLPPQFPNDWPNTKAAQESSNNNNNTLRIIPPKVSLGERVAARQRRRRLLWLSHTRLKPEQQHNHLSPFWSRDAPSSSRR